MLQVGSLVDNKYKILSEIGHGGMSVVYLAINERANKTWAIKEVRKDGVVDFESVKQGLIVETDMLKRLNHPNLPSIIDVIDTEDSFLIIMDYIEGTSLSKLLKTSGAQPEAKVVKWAKQLCDVLGYLHRQNPPIIYRDMKPANVMLKPDGNVTLIDFGTAREFKNRAMVEDTTCLGTRGYAAPEQFGGRGQTDGRTDIYCLGATLYHLLTGHSPAEPPYEIKPISYWIPQYAGSGLEKLILKCTKQDPDSRYQDCAELMYALEHYRDEDDRMQKKRKKQWRTFLIAAIIGLVGLVGAIGMLIARNSAVQKSYSYKIDQARQQDTLEAAEPYFSEAIELDRGRPDAYEALLEKVNSDMADHDGTLTSEATLVMNRILNESSGSTPNVEILARDNPDAYADLMYNIGLMYFFMKGNGEESYKKNAAENYFSKVTVEPYVNELEPQQAELAKLLQEIGGYIGNLNTNLSKYNQSEASYSQLFSDMREIVSGDLKEQVGLDIYCIKIYQQLASWIDLRYSDFSGAGISSDQMINLLDSLDSGLDDLKVTQNSNVYEDYQQAKDAVQAARNTLSSAFES